VGVIPSISVAVIAAPGPVTDLGLEIDPGAVTDLAQAAEIDPEVETGLEPEQDQARDQVQDLDQVREQDQAQGQVQVRDRVRERDQVQGQVQGLVQGLVRAGKVPLAANGIVEDPHQEAVNVVHPVVPANQDQEHQGAQRAEVVVADQQVVVVVDVAEEVEVAVVDVDVDLK